MSDRHAVAVGVVTAMMVAAAIPTFAIAVFAASFMTTFDVGHAAIGLLGTTLYLVATLLARRAGYIVDAYGSRRSGLALVAAVVTSCLLLAVATGFVVLLVAAAVAGFAMAVSNPVTNVLIRRRLPGHRQARALGIKQGGVAIGVVVGGSVLPLLASWTDWRVTIAMVGAVTLVLAPAWSTIDRAADRRDGPNGPRVGDASDRRLMRLLASFALMLGGVAGLTNTFYVVFAVEYLGLGPVAGGWVLASMGLVGASARWFWAEAGERRRRMGHVLLVITSVAMVGTAAMWWAFVAGGTGGPGASMVWVGAVLLGGTVMGWQGFVMFAVTRVADPSFVGRASGQVMQAFYCGLCISPVTIGSLIEMTDSYVSLWIAQSVLLVVATVIARRLLRYEHDHVATWQSYGDGLVDHDPEHC